MSSYLEQFGLNSKEIVTAQETHAGQEFSQEPEHKCGYYDEVYAIVFML
jgi:hypothetical protein